MILQRWVLLLLALSCGVAVSKELSIINQLKQQYTFSPVYTINVPSQDGQFKVESKMDAVLLGRNQDIASILLYSSIKQSHDVFVQNINRALFHCQNKTISYGTSYVSTDAKADVVLTLDLKTPFKSKADFIREENQQLRNEPQWMMALVKKQTGKLYNDMFNNLYQIACVNEVAKK
jgi:hypothetical protein